MFNVGSLVRINVLEDMLDDSSQTFNVTATREMRSFNGQVGVVVRSFDNPFSVNDAGDARCYKVELIGEGSFVNNYTYVGKWLTAADDVVDPVILLVDEDPRASTIVSRTNLPDGVVQLSRASMFGRRPLPTFIHESAALLMTQIATGLFEDEDGYVVASEEDDFVVMAGRGQRRYSLQVFENYSLSENSRYADWADYVLDEDAIYCEGDGEYYSNDDVGRNIFEHSDGEYYTSEEEPEDDVTGYHDGIRETTREAQTAKFTIGFEVEKEDRDLLESYDTHECERKGWARERDGSLDDEIGFELVSPVFDLFGDTLDKHLQTDAIRDHVDANYTSSCGGHINIGMKDVGGREFFDEIKGFIPLILTIYRHRLTNRYCRAQKNINDYKDGDKYTAINVKSRYIEIRVPGAVINTANLVWRRDLMRIMVNKYMGAGPVRILRDLTNKRSELHKHLLKVYGEEKMLMLASIYAQFADDFYNTYEVSENGAGLFFESALRGLKRKKVPFTAIISFVNNGFEILSNINGNTSRLNKSKELFAKVSA